MNNQYFNNNNQWQNRSEEVNDVLSNMPDWMGRWGKIMIVFLLVLFGLTAWLIRLPDTVHGKIKVTTMSPPVSLIAKANGRLTLLAENGQQVRKDQPLAVIENPANTADMRYVAAWLDSLQLQLATPSEALKDLSLRTDLQLGEAQRAYLACLKSIAAFKQFRNTDSYKKQLKQKKLELHYMQQILGILSNRKNVPEIGGQIDPLFGAGNANNLQQEKASAPADPEEISTIRYKVMVSQLRTELDKIGSEAGAREEQYYYEVSETARILAAQVKMWEDEYMLESPMDGKVAFSRYWSNYQFVKAGEEVAGIVPDDRNLVGKMLMPVQGSGKVITGQQVHIKLLNYPSSEYGILYGRVKAVSLLPYDEQYIIDVELPQGLTTSYHRTIGFRQDMIGQADIVVKDYRFFERIFHQLLKR
jgi:multidrug efflux pump subunit AcrA (membrane-fusion protein)